MRCCRGFQLQSTSDQQDFLRYPPIAAAAPAAIAPEQAAVWAYPQPDWTDDEIAFTLCSALLGRVHLSGHLDRMSEAQQQRVADAVSVYKGRIRPDLSGSVPFWPLGLPESDRCMGDSRGCGGGRRRALRSGTRARGHAEPAAGAS